jgi:hypothetical protein
MIKQIVNVFVFLFFAFLIGQSLVTYYIRSRPIREGLDGDSENSMPETTMETCKIPEANKPLELAALFETVGKQADMIRTVGGSTEPAKPIKIDKKVNEEFLVLANLQLLVNNGISKNEANLRTVYDQYIGNREIAVLATELNSLKLLDKDKTALHAKEEAFLCRAKIITEGHQTLINSILVKTADE